VLSGEVDHRESFLAALAALVIRRQDSRTLVDEYANVHFLSAGNSPEKLVSIRGAADAVQQEIAAVQVMIQTVKASISRRHR
jgi:hypothetical protein